MKRTNLILSAVLLCVTMGAALFAVSAQNVLINGAGATFPAPIYTKWFDAYHKSFPTKIGRASCRERVCLYV